MSDLAGTFERRLLSPVPAERLAVLRVLIGGYALGYLVIRAPHLLGTFDFDDARFDPVGPLWWLDDPLSPGAGRAIFAIALVSGVAFVAGWRWRLSGSLFALTFLAVTTYRNSWGQVWHTENLPALHLVLLALAPAAAAWSFDRRSGRRDPAGADLAWGGLVVRMLTLVTVLAYLVAGWAKLRNGGMAWITGDVLRNQIAHDSLRKALVGSSWSPLGAAALQHQWLFPPMAAFSVAVELGAPLALLRGRIRIGWVAAAWLFHVGVLALMWIGFPYQLLGIAYASFFPAERLGRQLRRASDGDAQPVVAVVSSA